MGCHSLLKKVQKQFLSARVLTRTPQREYRDTTQVPGRGGVRRQSSSYKLKLSTRCSVTTKTGGMEWEVGGRFKREGDICTLLFSCSIVSNSSVTPWTVACQAPLCMGFSRQEYWSWLPFPSPGDILDPGIKSTSPALAAGYFTTQLPGRPKGKGKGVHFIVI